MISFKNVNKWFGDLHVLKDINLDVAHGEVVVVCGPSGSGKSTLSAKRICKDSRRDLKKIGNDLTDGIEHADLRKCDPLIYQKQDEESIKEP